MIRRRREERAEEMSALDEIQLGDARRERIDGGIASRRFEKSSERRGRER